jgi:hypothetical protein
MVRNSEFFSPRHRFELILDLHCPIRQKASRSASGNIDQPASRPGSIGLAGVCLLPAAEVFPTRIDIDLT